MDIQETISHARKEYKDYLREKHPDWAESSLSTHVSDAFYLYQNTIALSFWKCFESDESMAAAKQDILEYLKHDVMSERAEERTAGYFNDLKMLKEFLDTKGGVRAYVGPEYDCEVTVYKYAKMAYDGALSSDDAVAAMCKEVPFFGETSHKLMVMLFASMMEGTRYTRRGNTETTIYFIVHIGQDYGKDRMVNALKATHQNITYYYEQTGNKSNSIRRGCTKVAKDNNIDMDFSEKMFEGIIPKESSDTALTVDDTAVRYWLYAAGDGSVNWENDYAEGIMAIGWDNMGDLMQYSSKEEMRAKMREVYGGTSSYKNQVHATWQFANDIKPGDIIFVKKGRKEIIGRGVVEGEYVYDPTREHYRNTRTVRWTDKGLWEHSEQLAMKTLTDVTPYTDFVKKTQSLFDGESTNVAIQDEDEEERTYDPYTEYYGAAEPPVRCGESHLSGLTEPPVDSYSAWAGSRPYTSLMERSLDGSMLSMLILYESYEMRSMMASARVLSPLQICWYHSFSRNWEQKMVDDFFLRLWISSKRFLASDSVSLSRSHSSIINRTGFVYFLSTLVNVPASLAACRSSNKSGRRTYFTV